MKLDNSTGTHRYEQLIVYRLAVGRDPDRSSGNEAVGFWSSWADPALLSKFESTLKLAIGKR
jgi:hypothetical protein